VPFNHEDVRAYVDTFFLDGSLTPVEQNNVANLPAWVQTGVVHDLKADALRRFRGLRQKFETDIPSADVSDREWQQAAQRWAELVVLRWEWDEAMNAADRTAWSDVQSKVEEAFGQWMMQTAGMHNQVRLWASQGHLHRLLACLHDEGFAVFVTADHGNVTATGLGNPQEGVLVETRGKRARVYDRPEFRDETATKFPESMRWPGYGLPPTYHVLLPRDLKAFTDEGDQIVAHGGIALEEVMVPFVAMSREDI
jgi:hypothetical protein